MTTQTQTQAEQQVLAAQRARFDATIAHDGPALERLMGDDLTYVHSSGRLESKAANIAAPLSSNPFSITLYAKPDADSISAILSFRCCASCSMSSSHDASPLASVASAVAGRKTTANAFCPPTVN